MLLGTAFSFLTTLPPDQVRRKDGSAIAVFETTTIKKEIAGLLEMYKVCPTSADQWEYVADSE